MKQIRFIAHRGNVKGKSNVFENAPEYIMGALMEGYDAEIDVWVHKDKPYLGHDEPFYPVSKEFLANPHLWIHAKNKEALNYLVNAGDTFHYFWHNTDWYTMTSKGYVWVYPGNPLVGNSISVLPEREEVSVQKLIDSYNSNTLVGICSDNINFYKENFKNI